MGTKRAYIDIQTQNRLQESNVFQYKDVGDYVRQSGFKSEQFRTKDLIRLRRRFNAMRANYESSMESFRQKQRRADIRSGGVQRRAFFETPQQPTAGGMRTTTGAA